MSLSVDLRRDVAHHGGATSRTVPASHPSDYDCRTEGVLSYCHIEVSKDGDVIVVRLGRHRVLDERAVTQISDELLGVADRQDCHQLLLDCSGVTRLSSAMLAKLLRLRKKMESKGENLRLCGLDSHLRSVFATTKLDRLFDIIENEVAARSAVACQRPPFAGEAV